MEIIKKCLICNKEFHAQLKEVRRGNGKFCSRNCSAIYGNKVRNKKWKLEQKNVFNSLNYIEEAISDYIAGFTDAEGCFTITCDQDKARFYFKIDLLAKDKFVLEEIKRVFNCGAINDYSLKNKYRNMYSRFSVQSIEELVRVVIPFFNKHKLRSTKQHDFEIFKKCLNIYLGNEDNKMDRALTEIKKFVLVR